MPATAQVAMLKRIPTHGMSLQEEEALWDELVAWCDVRQLFIGGSPDGAVIYSPIEDGLRKQWKWLRRTLEPRLELDPFELSMVSVGDLSSPRLRRACLEAISQAQRHLAERMQECADSLAGLASSANMRLTVAVSEGKRLEIRSRGGQFMVTVSRLDGKWEPAFERFSTQRLSAADLLADLFADWPALRWERQPLLGDPSRGECFAADSGNLRIELSGQAGSNLDGRKLLKLFLELMNDSGDC